MLQEPLKRQYAPLSLRFSGKVHLAPEVSLHDLFEAWIVVHGIENRIRIDHTSLNGILSLLLHQVQRLLASTYRYKRYHCSDARNLNLIEEFNDLPLLSSHRVLERFAAFPRLGRASSPASESPSRRRWQ